MTKINCHLANTGLPGVENGVCVLTWTLQGVGAQLLMLLFEP